jgi:AcrR family transcriptional regulator
MSAYAPDPDLANTPGEPSTPGTRESLRLAAVAAITEEGWQAAGARSVTRRAQVPLGAINYHFEGKEDLFRQAALAEIALMFRTPTQILKGSGSITELVKSMLRWSRADDVTELQRTLLLEVMAQSQRDPRLARLLAEALAGYRNNVVDALTRVQPGIARQPAADRAAVAAAFAAHCDGLWLHSVIESAFPHGAAGDAATTIWTAALQ